VKYFKLTIILISLLLISVMGFAQETQTSSETLTDIEKVYQHFSEDDIINIPYDETIQLWLEEAIIILKEELSVPEDLNEEDEEVVDNFIVSSDKKDIVNKLAQLYYTLANVFLSGADYEKQTYEKGKHWGIKSLRMSPEFAELEQDQGFIKAVENATDYAALYWTSSNWLRVAEFDKIAAIFANVPKKSEAILKRCLELKPDYVCYGPYRSLGAFWGGLPRLPMGHFRKNLSEAQYYLCQVVSNGLGCCDDYTPIDPLCDDYLENRTFFAEFYLIEKGFSEKAREVLEGVLAEPIGDKYPFMNAYAQDNARQLLENL
jgi:hypothetical protein